MQTTPRFVRNSSQYWHKPKISRDDGTTTTSSVLPTFYIFQLEAPTAQTDRQTDGRTEGLWQDP